MPVYQDIIFTLDAELEAVSSSSIEATSDLDTSFIIKAGMIYDGENWSPIANKEFKKDYTGIIRVAGGVTLKARFIPNIEVKFYEVTSAGLSVEPWVKGDLKATANTKLKTNLENYYDILVIHKVEKFDIDTGIDINVYADLKLWKINLHYPLSGGKKNILNPHWKIFSIPTIKLSIGNNSLMSDSKNSCQIIAKITDGVGGNKLENISWFVFPKYGATITPNGSNEAILSFDKEGYYDVYLVGNSKKLGEYFGKQYEYIKVDTDYCSSPVEEVGNNHAIE